MILQETLAKALNIGAGFTGQGELSNVLLSIDNNVGTLFCMDGVASITLTFPARGTLETVAIPAKTMLDVVNRMSKERIEMEVLAGTFVMRCGMSTIHLRTLPLNDYPTPSRIEPIYTAQIEKAKDFFADTLICAAKDNARPILFGVEVSVKEDRVVGYGADGYRLAARTVLANGKFSGVIHRTYLEMLQKKMPDEVSIGITGAQCCIAFSLDEVNIEALIPLAEGRYPDVSSILKPKPKREFCTVDRKELLTALKRCAVMARDSAFSVKVESRLGGLGTPGEIKLSAKSAERGDVITSVDCDVTEILITNINATYFMQVLTELEDKQDEATKKVRLYATSGDSPLFVTPDDDTDKCIYVIMPMAR